MSSKQFQSSRFASIGLVLPLLFNIGIPQLRAAQNWKEIAGGKLRALEIPPGRTGFDLVNPNNSGLLFTNRIAEQTAAMNRIYENGSGVALGDVDGDERVDIYFCRMDGSNVLYRNLGDWRFEDITTQAGVECPGQHSTGCVFADVDGDGDLDLLVNGIGAGTRLFLNDAHGKFAELRDTRLVRRFGSMSMGLADMDRDGDLDLYVTNYRTDTFKDSPPGLRVVANRAKSGAVTVEPRDRFIALGVHTGGVEVVERGERDFFYLNTGKGRFEPVSWTLGSFQDENGAPLATPPTDWGLSVLFRDLNDDGWPDLFVCNDFVYWPDRIWINQKGGGFRAIAKTALRCQSLSSMAVDAADIDRDGHDDLFVADMLSQRHEWRAWQRPNTLEGIVNWPIHDPDFRPEVTRNTLFLNRGNGTFSEIAQLAGVAATEWTWTAAFLDVDLDGWEDLLIANGNNHDVQDADVQAELKLDGAAPTPENKLRRWRKFPRLANAAIAFRNERDLRFTDKSKTWGFDQNGVAHGMALGDLDNDGDLDAVMNCMDEAARVYRNRTSERRIAVRLNGKGANTRGIGARLTFRGGPVEQSQIIVAGGRYCSSDDASRTFACGTSSGPFEVVVRWPAGGESRVTSIPANHEVLIVEPRDAPAMSSPLSEELKRSWLVQRALPTGANHMDAAFNDFANQPLLPKRLGTAGAGVALDTSSKSTRIWVTGGRGGRLSGWATRTNSWYAITEFPGTNDCDQTAILVLDTEPGREQILVGQSFWELPLSNTNGSLQIFGNQGSTSIGSERISVGALASADIDNDGDLDLFLGGRAISGRWPQSTPSQFIISEGDEWKTGASYSDLGLINSAVFADLDNDADPDLVLAVEWGPIRILINERGDFVDRSAQWKTHTGIGWWNSVVAGDFDNDGQIDIAAGNWGLNFGMAHLIKPGAPVRLVYGDFTQTGRIDTLLCSHDKFLSGWYPWRELKVLSAAWPRWSEKAPTHHTYGRMPIDEVLGNQAAKTLEASAFASVVLLNRGGVFDVRELPISAQVSPVFGLCAADIDGDGFVDLAGVQNFFGVDAETSRFDGGIGFILKGLGDGSFKSIPPIESGFVVMGEGRGLACGDVNGDGRVDLVSTEYRGRTVLWENRLGKTGKSLRLRQSGLNRRAIGGRVRAHHGDKRGPAMEIRLGSGYQSQDSTDVLLANPETITALEIRWPDGKPQTLIIDPIRGIPETIQRDP